MNKLTRTHLTFLNRKITRLIGLSLLALTLSCNKADCKEEKDLAFKKYQDGIKNANGDARVITKMTEQYNIRKGEIEGRCD